jgi:hypothetical protein
MRKFGSRKCSHIRSANRVHCISLLISMNRPAIVSLAARRKGIARSAVLHLDDARSAWGEVVIGFT